MKMLTDEQLFQMLRNAYKAGHHDGAQGGLLPADDTIDGIMGPVVHPSGYDGRGNPVPGVAQ